MKLLCVEEYSVDLESLNDLRDGKVLVYRRGAEKPFVLDLPDDQSALLLTDLINIKIRLESILKLATPESEVFQLNNDKISILNKFKSIVKLLEQDCLGYINSRIKEIKKNASKRKN